MVRRPTSSTLTETRFPYTTLFRSLPVDAAFIGSCTNSRLSDLRRAAALLRGRKVAPGVKAICVPGSTDVRARAEAEGIDRVFLDAGFEWREAGCRSEEHTYELQSLMRTSYAVFCVKKNNRAETNSYAIDIH